MGLQNRSFLQGVQDTGLFAYSRLLGSQGQEEEGQESHVIGDCCPGDLSRTPANRLANTAIDGLVGREITDEEIGLFWSDISEHVATSKGAQGGRQLTLICYHQL